MELIVTREQIKRPRNTSCGPFYLLYLSDHSSSRIQAGTIKQMRELLDKALANKLYLFVLYHSGPCFLKRHFIILNVNPSALVR